LRSIPAYVGCWDVLQDEREIWRLFIVDSDVTLETYYEITAFCSAHRTGMGTSWKQMARV